MNTAKPLFCREVGLETATSLIDMRGSSSIIVAVALALAGASVAFTGLLMVHLERLVRLRPFVSPSTGTTIDCCVMPGSEGQRAAGGRVIRTRRGSAAGRR